MVRDGVNATAAFLGPGPSLHADLGTALNPRCVRVKRQPSSGCLRVLGSFGHNSALNRKPCNRPNALLMNDSGDVADPLQTGPVMAGAMDGEDERQIKPAGDCYRGPENRDFVPPAPQGFQ